MASDWSDPEKVERELQRRERGEPPGDDAPSDMRLLLAAMLVVLKAQKRTDTRTATLTEDSVVVVDAAGGGFSTNEA